MKSFLIRLILLLFITLPLVQCDYFLQNASEEDAIPIARVKNKYLYLSDIQSLLDDSMSMKDSVEVVNAYIDSWIRKSLMLEKASSFLSTDRLDIQKQVKDYEESLVVYTYERELLKSKLDTIITENEIKNYYNEFPANFTLKHNIVKGTYIVVDHKSPKTDSLNHWFRDDDPYSKDRLQTYCYQYAKTFSLESQWYALDDVRNRLPAFKHEDLRGNTFFGAKDSTNIYLLKIGDYINSGRLAPLEYVEQDIIRILVNKRKVTFINGINNKVYEEGVERENFEVFDINENLKQ